MRVKIVTTKQKTNNFALNIFSNFVPNIVTISDNDQPWMNKRIKSTIMKNQSLHKIHKNGERCDNLAMLQNVNVEVSNCILSRNINHLARNLINS